MSANTTTRWVRRYKLQDMLDGKPRPDDSTPWVMDCRSFDIPPTIEAMIRNCTSPSMVAVSLSLQGGPDMIRAAEAAAKEKGIRILWWVGPQYMPASGIKAMRQLVRECRQQ